MRATKGSIWRISRFIFYKIHTDNLLDPDSSDAIIVDFIFLILHENVGHMKKADFVRTVSC